MVEIWKFSVFLKINEYFLNFKNGYFSWVVMLFKNLIKGDIRYGKRDLWISIDLILLGWY